LEIKWQRRIAPLSGGAIAVFGHPQSDEIFKTQGYEFCRKYDSMQLNG
jgi:hypothetical protein